VDSIPVISSGGDTVGDLANPGVGIASQGGIAISPDGRRIAVTGRDFRTHIGDFNTSTGEISNIKYITNTGSAYGVAFSIDGNKLYSSCVPLQLLQHDVSLNSTAAIIASEYLVANSGNIGGSLQLGPDGKIYCTTSNSQTIGVIQNPNASGIACGFVDNGVYLGAPPKFGLPTFLTDYLAPKKAAKIQGDSVICDVSTYYIKNNCGLGGDSISWILNGSSSIVSAIDSAITISPSQAGVDTLISFQYSSCGIVSDTLLIQVETSNLSLNLGKDTSTCDLVSMQLDAGPGFVDYLWSTANNSQTINVNSEGIYWVEVIDLNGCKSRDTIEIIQANASPPVDLGPDTMVCPGIVIPMDAGPGYIEYAWQDFSDNQLFTAWLPGTYWVEATDSCGNISMDTIQVLAVDTVNLSLGADSELCNEEAELDAGTGYVTYLWQDGSTAQTYTALDSGIYIVQVSTAEGCAYSDTIRIDLCETSITTGPSFAYLPNVFYTSSNNPENEKLFVFGKNIKSYELAVYDRWGEMVYETNDSSKKLRSDGVCCAYGEGWDGTFRNTGKPLNEAVFVFILKGEFTDGKKFNETGNITLIK
jgi:hypothetical protein